MTEGIYAERGVSVVGAGEAGIKIAAQFATGPSFLPVHGLRFTGYRPSEEYYPIRWVGFDTEPSTIQVLQRMGWSQDLLEQRLFIIHTIPDEEIRRKLLKQFGQDAPELRETWGTSKMRLTSAGIGGQSIAGLLTAEYFFTESESEQFRNEIRDKIQRDSLLFPRDALLLIHGLAGGTGSGFAPYLLNFLVGDVLEQSALCLTISALPNTNDKSHPISMLLATYHLLNNTVLAGVVLIDNAYLLTAGHLRDLIKINEWVHEVLSPLLVAFSGRYNRADFASTLDPADTRRWLTPRGYLVEKGPAQFCCIGFSRLPFPWIGQPDPDELLSELVENCFKNVSVLPDVDEQRRVFASGAVGILSGPPRLYDKILRKATYDQKLQDMISSNINWSEGVRLKMGYLQFDQQKDARLTLVLGGVEPVRLRNILGTVEQSLTKRARDQTLADRIRALDERRLYEAYIQEVGRYFIGPPIR
ncbi:MAG: hypothetical protein QW420_07465 [Candidatus Caldarchaeum sp.]